MKCRLEPAVHHLHLRPMRVLHPAIELAAPERADRDDERRAANLLAEADELRAIELLGPVHREAVGRPAELAREHRDLGRIGAEVGVKVGRAGRTKPRQHPAGLGQVDQVIGQRPVGAARHPEGEAQRREELARRSDQPRGQGNAERQHTVLQDVARSCLLPDILVVRDLGIPATESQPLDSDALALQGQDLAPDERMADLRILIDQVGHRRAHCPRPLSVGRCGADTLFGHSDGLAATTPARTRPSRVHHQLPAEKLVQRRHGAGPAAAVPAFMDEFCCLFTSAR